MKSSKPGSKGKEKMKRMHRAGGLKTLSLWGSISSTSSV